jgi:hypothetical protein
MLATTDDERRDVELSKSAYRLSPNLALIFEDAEVEKEYCDQLAVTLDQQKVTFLKVLHIAILFIVLYFYARELLQSGTLLSPYQLVVEQYPAFIFGAIILTIGLRFAPQRKSEHAVCGALLMALLGLIMYNPLRNRRLGVSSAEYSSFNEFWIQACDLELVESTRDTLRVCCAVSLHSFFHIFLRVRTKLSFLMPVSLVLVSCFTFVPPFKLNDASNSFNNVALLVSVCAGHWFGSYRNELRDRLVWELQRRLDAFEQRDALLRLVFPAVVLVSSDGIITPSDALNEQFGSGISRLQDLPTQNSQDVLSDGLQLLVNEVLALKLPAKRRVMIRPRGGTQVFLCTVCVVIAKLDERVRLGFEIHDTWQSNAEPVLAQGQVGHEATRLQVAAAQVPEARDHHFEYETTASGTSNDESLSMDESEASVSAAKRVVFAPASGSFASSAGRKKQRTKQRRYSKVPMPKSFRIASSDLENTRGPNFARRPRVEFHTTAVELHSRCSQNPADVEISEELRVMLQVRHPNIILLLGVAFDFPGGPVLVMEQTWGSVSTALARGPLDPLSALRIADQINAAVHYLRKLQMRHGAVGIDNVDLLSSPRSKNVTAKLTNFACATLCDSDQVVFEEDICACAVFISNLFVRKRSQCVQFDTTEKEDLCSLVSHNNLQIGAQFPLLVETLNLIVSSEANLTAEVDQIDQMFNNLHRLFTETIQALSEQTPGQQPWEKLDGQALLPSQQVATKLEKRSRPADRAQQRSHGDTHNAPFPAHLNLENLEFSQREVGQGSTEETTTASSGSDWNENMKLTRVISV